MEIKASGEENGVMIAKDRPYQPELTDLLGTLHVHGVQGPWQDSEDRGHQILGEAHAPYPVCCRELSGLQIKNASCT